MNLEFETFNMKFIVGILTISSKDKLMKISQILFVLKTIV